MERGHTLRKLIRENKFAFVGLMAVFLFLPVLTILDINKVESGLSRRESVIIPVGLIYKMFGYWPAVLFLPACYVAAGVYIMYRFILPRRK